MQSRKHAASLPRPCSFTLIFAVYSENPVKYKNVLCGQNEEFSNDKAKIEWFDTFHLWLKCIFVWRLYKFRSANDHSQKVEQLAQDSTVTHYMV